MEITDLKYHLQLADKCLLKPVKEAKYPNSGCLNCLTTCKSNHLYPILTSRRSSREQPTGQPKAQEIGMKERFCCEEGTAENKDFESKISHLCFGECKNNLVYFSKERKTDNS